MARIITAMQVKNKSKRNKKKKAHSPNECVFSCALVCWQYEDNGYSAISIFL